MSDDFDQDKVDACIGSTMEIAVKEMWIKKKKEENKKLDKEIGPILKELEDL